MSKHHNFLDTVDEVFKGAMQNGVWQLSTDVPYIEEHGGIDGRLLKLKTYDKPLINFGNCSYLGLETDKRLIQGAIHAALKHGTQVSSSRAYLSSGLYDELEAKFETMFGGYVVISPTTTLGHFSSLPTLLDDNDAVILDQFVHASVQRAVTTEKSRGVKIDVLRHNRLDKLEEQIKELRQKHARIWYMIDGVYSMYGQLAPVKELVGLLNRYEQFYLYVDDAHGMGWSGKHGRGYTLGQTDLHPKMVVATSLAKAFGTTGGVLVFPEKEMAQKVRTVGYTMIFSGPLVPPVLGASLVSADIMLSDELPPMQQDLLDRIEYGNRLIVEKKLPYVELSNSPIFFICLGHPRVGYNISRRLMLEGFYTNLAIFPAVPVKNTGLRLTFTLHTTKQDIKNLMDAVEHHLPKALEEEGRSIEDVYKAFKIEGVNGRPMKSPRVPDNNTGLTLEILDSIHQIKQSEWDNLFVGKGLFDWNGLELLERTFCGNPETENNWRMRYYIVRDEEGRVVTATCFTLALVKDDMLSSARVSLIIEEQRKNDPYYLCSLQYGMGTPLTEGEHLHLKRDHKKWKIGLKMLLEQASTDRQDFGAKSLTLRDFNKEDSEIRDFLIQEGFFHYDMPDNHVIDISDWGTPSEYEKKMTSNGRRFLKRYVHKYTNQYSVEFWKNAADEQIELLYMMYKRLKQGKLELNTFDLPFSLFRNLSVAKNWELMVLRLANNRWNTEFGNIAAFSFNYISGRSYLPLLGGVDRSLIKEVEPYRQLLYRNILRAKEQECRQLGLAFTASIEKKHFGAILIPTTMFIDSEDNFVFNKISVI